MIYKKITIEELLSFSKSIYYDACLGHLDLMDGYCEREVEKIFEKLSELPSVASDDKKNSDFKIYDSETANRQINPQLFVSNQFDHNNFSTNEIYAKSITITTNTSDIF